jgi:hypothetical protein
MTEVTRNSAMVREPTIHSAAAELESRTGGSPTTAAADDQGQKMPDLSLESSTKAHKIRPKSQPDHYQSEEEDDQDMATHVKNELGKNANIEEVS